MSRPSVNACRTDRGTPARRRAGSAPPGGRSPSARRRRRRARSGAPARRRVKRLAQDGVPGQLPCAIASSMRVRSCSTTAPAPRFRCPTSELPIWSAGSPTARPEAVRGRVGIGATARRTRACWRARPRCRARRRDPPAIEHDQRRAGPAPMRCVGEPPSTGGLDDRGETRRPGWRRRRAPRRCRARQQLAGVAGLTLPPYRIRALTASPSGDPTSPDDAIASWAISGVAIRPVPIAQIGS